ncbi:Secreted RxLR effector peptide protein [Phytophthora palmivora]|uniref:Secreted RxLR effector peptide protein n=1 Tax=Phytophthora palmivora TaxID=4796 RepID=A0A2P4YN72_9STRA|nr:Secreted RxLR effector peptide protein [Phytophthora palmivora]
MMVPVVVDAAAKEWSLLEFQGDLLPGDGSETSGLSGLDVGTLRYGDGDITLRIGNHVLTGKVTKLPKPFAILEKGGDDSQTNTDTQELLRGVGIDHLDCLPVVDNRLVGDIREMNPDWGSLACTNFKLWSKHVAKVNKENPEAAMLTALTNVFGEKEVAIMILLSKDSWKVGSVVKKLEKAQFNKWFNARKRPDNVLENVLGVKFVDINRNPREKQIWAAYETSSSDGEEQAEQGQEAGNICCGGDDDSGGGKKQEAPTAKATAKDKNQKAPALVPVTADSGLPGFTKEDSDDDDYVDSPSSAMEDIALEEEDFTNLVDEDPHVLEEDTVSASPPKLKTWQRDDGGHRE